MLSLEWKPFQEIEISRIANARAQLHVAIQNISALGRRFLGDSSSDTNAALFWIPGLSRMAGHWLEGNIRFRSSLSLEDFSLYLVDDRVNTISSFQVKGSNHRKIMLWLEEQIGKLGLSASELALKLPNKLKDNPQLNGAPFDLADDEAIEELGRYYHNSFLVLRALKAKLDWKNEIHIWPHHFDLSISVTLRDSGHPETDTRITIGMMPGDDQNDHPYFYVSTWPHVHTSKMNPLNEPGRWIEEDWTGRILSLEELVAVKTEDQQDLLSSFFESGFHSLIEPLTK